MSIPSPISAKDKDFDPVSGKLVSPARPVPSTGPALLSNPAALAPTGSPAGRLAPADGFRSLLSGIGVYGAVTMASQLLDYFGASPNLFPLHGAEWAALCVAASHLVTAYMRDNTPRVP